MKRIIVSLAALAVCLMGTIAQAQVVSGQLAPDFTLTDSNGQAHSLAGFKGKYVVLEWVNHSCPFVVKHYGSGNMQSLQKEFTAKDVVWLSINSSAAGKEGAVNGQEANALTKEKGAAPTAVLLDSDGKAGKLYGAKTTPHMFVINPEGILIYQGAIDDKASADPADIAGAKNYVREALTAAMAGQPVAESSTKSYGCSVKY
jgi:peroxiredoxin